MFQVKVGNSLTELANIAPSTVHTVVTSPPYWNLRGYHGEGDHWPASEFQPLPGAPPIKVPEQYAQLGSEADPNDYIGHMIQIMRGCYAALHDEGSVWVNIGDTYLKSGVHGMQAKSLCGIPWRFALAMQADGWCLRNDVIWHKTRVLPSPVKDRFTTDHEYVFLFTKKSKGYFFDTEAVREPCKSGERDRTRMKEAWKRQGGATLENHEPTGAIGAGSNAYAQYSVGDPDKGRNRRTTWAICPSNYRGEHFATFPKELARICIEAGTSEAGACSLCKRQWVREGEVFAPSCACSPQEPEPSMVLDPFAGAGTTLLVSEDLGRDSIGIEISGEYSQLIEERIHTHLRKKLGPLDPDYPQEEKLDVPETVSFTKLFE